MDIGGANYATPALDPGVPTNRKCDLPKMKAGGLDAVFLAAFVGQRPDLDASRIQAGLRPGDRRLRRHRPADDRCTRSCASSAGRPADVERIAKTGKRVILIGVENGYPMGDDLANLKAFYDRGARYMTLVHASHNQLADSSGAGPADAQRPVGARQEGRRRDEPPRHDGGPLARLATKSFWDAIAVSKAPIIESHSGCKALSPSDRNLDDEQLKALAKNGGVIQIVALGELPEGVRPSAPRRLPTCGRSWACRRAAAAAGRAARAARRPGGTRRAAGADARGAGGRAGEARRRSTQERMKEIDAKYPGATLKDFVDHIDHAVKVAGIDHVGIGTDFDGGGGVPGFNDHSEALNVTVELVQARLHRGADHQDLGRQPAAGVAGGGEGGGEDENYDDEVERRLDSVDLTRHAVTDAVHCPQFRRRRRSLTFVRTSAM